MCGCVWCGYLSSCVCGGILLCSCFGSSGCMCWLSCMIGENSVVFGMMFVSMWCISCCCVGCFICVLMCLWLILMSWLYWMLDG